MQATSYPTTYLSTRTRDDFDQMSVYEWIERYVAGGHESRMGRLLDAAYNIEYGAENRTRQRSTSSTFSATRRSPGNFLIYGKSDERFHIAGGNERCRRRSPGTRQPRDQARLGRCSLRANTDGTVSMSFATPGQNTDAWRLTM